jgi:nucleotide-binding universal stress UspA family protein
MIRITNILCPTDFSLFAQAAVPIACSLARDYGATLILLHVRPSPVTIVGEFGVMIPPEPREPDETLKARMRQCVPSSFKGMVECQIQDGDAAEAILKTAQQRNCDLIVLGTHGRSGLRRLLVGSVAEAILRRAPCPVLTVKPPATEPTAVSSSADAVEKEPSLNSNELVTVCSVANPAEADVIRNALNGERIPCFVEGAQQAALVGTLGIPIKIQVRLCDFDRACKFIQTCEAHRY